MAAYAVLARIDRVDPHLAGRSRIAGADWLVPEPPEPPEAIDLVAHPLAPGLVERWSGIREAWAQTTFYLFNAEGWR